MKTQKTGPAQIKISRIYVGENHRTTDNRGEIERLASSIDAHGLQNRLVVSLIDPEARPTDSDPGQDVRLVSGSRRLAAVASLGRDVVDVEIVHCLTDAEIEARRAVENSDRLDLNLLEQARAVGLMLGARMAELDDLAEEEREAEARTWVAQALGRSVSWVRDNLFLTRLEGAARDLTECGALPIAYAREIAKLADAKAQGRIAEACFARTYDSKRGSTPDRTRLALTLEEVRRQVSGAMHSLHGVPWVLDQAFAGKPACDTCDFNSAVAAEAGLFTADGDAAPERAACLQSSCYLTKRSRIEQGITATLTRHGKALEGMDSITPRTLQREGMVPKGVKPTTMASRARKHVDGASSPTQAPASKPRTAQTKGEHERAVERWQTRNKDIPGRLEEVICDRGAKDPALVLRALSISLMPQPKGDPYLYTYFHSEESAKRVVGSIRKAERAQQSSEFNAIVAALTGATIEDIHSLIVAEVKKPREARGKRKASRIRTYDGLFLGFGGYNSARAAALLLALGEEVEYASIDSCLEEARKAATTQAKKAAKKASKKKTAKKTSRGPASKKPVRKKASKATRKSAKKASKKKARSR